MTRVGVAGFEPTTSSSRTKHATKLRHTPREATTAYRTGGVRSQTLGSGSRGVNGYRRVSRSTARRSRYSDSFTSPLA